MEFIKKVIGIFICLIVTGCVHWERDVIMHGIHFDKFAYDSKLGSPKGYLAADTIIQGYPCKKGFVSFYDDWKLDEFQLSQPVRLNDEVVIPTNSWGFLDRDGNLTTCMLPVDLEIQGYPCRGGGGKAGFMTSFHKNGNLKYFFTKDDIEIDSIPCSGSIFHGIGLHESGNLESCTLAKTTTIQNRQFKKKSKIVLNGEGNLVNLD